MKKIGWIWLWVMWNPMANNLLKEWYELYVYNRDKSKAENLVKDGAFLCSSVSELVKKVDIVFTIIWDPKSVENMYFWNDWILENINSWKVVVDMTTTKPSLAFDIYNKAKEKGVFSLDAPVSGWDVWAINWSLSIMVWWDEEKFNELLDIFNILWKTVVYCWEASKGQHTKMANQVSIAWNTIALCESLVYAEKAWLDIENTIKVVSSWAWWSWGWTNLAPRINRWELDTCFFIKHFVKDMRIILEECQNMNISLPWLSLVHQFYTSLIAKWDEWLWTQALIKFLRGINNMK